jgi:hypothetical protein
MPGKIHIRMAAIDVDELEYIAAAHGDRFLRRRKAPLLRIMPPTRPVPSSISALSRTITSAPAFFAATAALTPAQPPPMTTIFVMLCNPFQDQFGN